MSTDSIIRLNKFVAHSGLCSRRKADELIRSGKIKVNLDIVRDPAYELKRSDKVFHKGKQLWSEKPVYILLNKPKDYISTTDDEKGRKTVLDIVQPSLSKLMRGKEVRLYPVGRLDRNTTGLILLTNDGELAQKLAHPSRKVQKTYKVTLDKDLTREHKEMILQGLELEDGIAKVDEIGYAESNQIIGITLHSGKNRIVRRIFEHLGYKVVKLDRVLYAGLTKKSIPRGKWRFLNPYEIRTLKRI